MTLTFLDCATKHGIPNRTHSGGLGFGIYWRSPKFVTQLRVENG